MNKGKDSLKELIKKLLGESKIGLIDVGSSGGLEPRWSKIDNFLNCFFFEPDMRSYNEIVSQVENRGWIIYPSALYSKHTKKTLYLCRKPQVSSLYHPNRAFLDLFPNKERWDVLKTILIDTESLDNVIKDLSTRQKCDFIKLDTQGSELSILEGAVQTLDYVFGVECEVEFLPLYKDQPLFGDICIFLEKQGFSFIDFSTLIRWNRQSYKSKRGQLVFGDALFLKSPERVISELNQKFLGEPEKAKSKLLRYICILILYDKIDYVQFICDNYSKYFEIESLSNILKKDYFEKYANYNFLQYKKIKNIFKRIVKKIEKLLKDK